MQGYDAKIFVVGGVTIILNLVGWRMYVLLGDKVYIYDGWAGELPGEDDALPLTSRLEHSFAAFLQATPAEKIVEHMSITMTLYRSEQEIRQTVTRVIAELQKQLAGEHEKRESA